jgi:hypothetical protein
MIKAHNVIPALKDSVISFPMALGTIPTGQNAVMFFNPFYDYQIVAMAALVTTTTQAAAVAFKIGTGAYTDENGVVQAAIPEQFLPAANALDINGQPFSTQVLPAGTLQFFPIQPDPQGLGLNILRAGQTLVVSGPTVTNSGNIILSIALRPKDKDRNDFSKRPGGAADAAYATYYK